MIKVVLFGSGNVAQHLLIAFQQSGKVDVIQVVVRDKKRAELSIASNRITENWDAILQADIYILAVSDAAAGELSSKLPFKNALVAHTSGSLTLNALDPKNRRAVFYPLQTFSKNRAIDYSKVPVCLEWENTNDQQLLNDLASCISPNCYTINSVQRKALHVAAVMVNNFVNHLYHIGEEICEEHQVPFAILEPLIAETAEKIKHLSPRLGQTGPAIRHDQNTIQAHLDLLTQSNHKAVYTLLTDSIQNNYAKK
ncbi:MAG: DUF2520 domain-containing protein [Flavobacterium sp.]|nr:DUF2520 domain-containing protein [Flavobacterium sp.]